MISSTLAVWLINDCSVGAMFPIRGGIVVREMTTFDTDKGPVAIGCDAKFPTCPIGRIQTTRIRSAYDAFQSRRCHFLRSVPDTILRLTWAIYRTMGIMNREPVQRLEFEDLKKFLVGLEMMSNGYIHWYGTGGVSSGQ